MIQLRVSSERVGELFHHVPHAKFQNSKHRFWRVDENGVVRPSSALWLFRWAYNGDGSKRAARYCQDTWNEVMPWSYGLFLDRVGADFAFRHRYKTSGDINCWILQQIELRLQD